MQAMHLIIVLERNSNVAHSCKRLNKKNKVMRKNNNRWILGNQEVHRCAAPDMVAVVLSYHQEATVIIKVSVWISVIKLIGRRCKFSQISILQIKLWWMPKRAITLALWLTLSTSFSMKRHAGQPTSTIVMQVKTRLMSERLSNVNRLKIRLFVKKRWNVENWWSARIQLLKEEQLSQITKIK